MFDFSIITTWIDNLLRLTLGLGDFWTILIECVLVGVMLLVGYAMIAIVLIFMERKVCAYFQCRIGPMRVGPWGLLQVFADVLKMLIKEIFFVDKADKVLYLIAPFLVIIASVGTFSFLPWNNGAVVLDFNVGIFLLTAVSGIGVVGMFLAGWGSNNKYHPDVLIGTEGILTPGKTFYPRNKSYFFMFAGTDGRNAEVGKELIKRDMQKVLLAK